MITEESINGFFKDIQVVLSDQKTSESKPVEDELIRSVDDKDGDIRTNVIYLNTDCNLRCEYCYEENSRNGLPDQYNVTTKQIDEFVQSVKKREKDLNSCIVVMGGEPTLRFDLLEYLIHRLSTIPKKGGWAVLMTTNAVLLNKEKYLNKLKNIIRLATHNNILFTTEVSYDCSGQYRRKFPNGANSKYIVEQSMNTLVEHNIDFCISYTVHSGNYDRLVEDCIYIFEKWPTCNKVSMSFAYKDLDSVSPGFAFKLKENFLPYAKELFKIYKKPICGVLCGTVCRRCNLEDSVGNSYLSPTSGISYADKETETAFQQF